MGSPTFWHWNSVTVAESPSAVDSENVTPRRTRRSSSARAQASLGVLRRAAGRGRGPRLPTVRAFSLRAFPAPIAACAHQACIVLQIARAGPLFKWDERAFSVHRTVAVVYTGPHYTWVRTTSLHSLSKTFYLFPCTTASAGLFSCSAKYSSGFFYWHWQFKFHSNIQSKYIEMIKQKNKKTITICTSYTLFAVYNNTVETIQLLPNELLKESALQ